MCVIVYKPLGKKLPNTDILKRCFQHNPDGAGYMLPINNKVVIRKGFMDFDSFTKDLEKVFSDNKLNIYDTPVVLHFRIGTQGANSPELTHPYPICRDYNEMRKTTNECDIALAHNGIISSCSDRLFGSHYDYKTRTWVTPKTLPLYNDTMTYIKNYASLIIDNDMNFAKKPNKVELLERLCENSKLAIMNSKGFVKLIGRFELKDGIYYSNLYHEVSPIKNDKGFTHVSDILSDLERDGYDGYGEWGEY